MGEHAHAARYCESHAAKFTQELVILLSGNAAATTEQIEEFLYTVEAVRREFNGSPNCVNQPA
jgi:hypothetical protein